MGDNPAYELGSEECPFARIIRVARNLQILGFEGVKGLIATCCNWLLDINWAGCYLDGQRPSPANGLLLPPAERLLLDNVGVEHLRVQYRILAEETFKAP